MSKQPLFVHILLDRSGSMETNRDTTIDAFNEYVNAFRVSKDIDARLSLTLFDSEGIDAVQIETPVSEFPELSRRTFEPRAMTPLLDAIGKAVEATDKVALRPDEKVTLVILTDGMENASREYTLEAVRALLDGRRKDKNWLIVFLGADIDAFAAGGQFGLSADVSLGTRKASLKGAMRATGAMQARYALGDLNPSYTPEERQQAMRDE